MMKIFKLKPIVTISALTLLLLTGCNNNESSTALNAEESTSENAVAFETASNVETVRAGNTAYDPSQSLASWDNEEETTIALTAREIDGEGANFNDDVLTIDSAGTYRLSGTFKGSVVVADSTEGLVRIVLDNADIRSEAMSAISFMGSEQAVVYLQGGTSNVLEDAESYTYIDQTEEEPSAALFSKTDLVITGEGDLTVKSNFNDGVTSKDNLYVDTSINVSAKDDGLVGKDSITVADAALEVEAGGDAFKASNDSDEKLGFILVESGVVDARAVDDVFSAATDIIIVDGKLNLQAEGTSEEESSRGLNAEALIAIGGGEISIKATEDGIHSSGSISVEAGSIGIEAGDDGVNASGELNISGGDLTIVKSYEGLEAKVISVSDGNINVTSSDDGLNASDGSSSEEGMMNPQNQNMEEGQRTRPQMPEGQAPTEEQLPEGQTFEEGKMPQRPEGVMPEQSGAPEGAGRENMSGDSNTGGMPGESAAEGVKINITGGNITIDAQGDGIDSNGTFSMTGGSVFVNGPTSNGNGALDSAGTISVTGGTLVAVGSSGMVQTPNEGQAWVSFTGDFSAGDNVGIFDNSGAMIIGFALTKDTQSVVVSSPDLTKGESYELRKEVTFEGENLGGFYTSGEGGTKVGEATANSSEHS